MVKLGAHAHPRLRSLALLAHLSLPVFMAWAWMLYFSRQLSVTLSLAATVIALCGVTVAYGCDRLFDPDPRVQADARWVRAFLLLTTIAAILIACVYVTELSQRQWIICGLCLLCSIGNWACKKVSYAKTIFVALSWLCACIILPENIGEHSWLTDPHVYIWLLLFSCACILCDMKDTGLDRLRGIRSFPVMHGEKCAIYAVQFLCAIIVVICILYKAPALCILAIVLFFIAMRHKLLQQEIYAPLLIDGALTLCALLPFLW